MGYHVTTCYDKSMIRFDHEYLYDHTILLLRLAQFSKGLLIFIFKNTFVDTMRTPLPTSSSIICVHWTQFFFLSVNRTLLSNRNLQQLKCINRY